jgi:hypothetical protein
MLQMPMGRHLRIRPSPLPNSRLPGFDDATIIEEHGKLIRFATAEFDKGPRRTSACHDDTADSRSPNDRRPTLVYHVRETRQLENQSNDINEELQMMLYWSKRTAANKS